jgi:thiamine-phosphate pyrophosphorylase
MDDFGIYVIITKPVLSYADIAGICVRTNVKMLQIREKDMCDRELLEVCRTIAPITKGTQTRFIVNDRVDIALLCNADGVHLGQGDVSIEDARQLLPAGKIIGLSTHSVEQAREAIAHHPDYIGFGPVYKTPTKKVPDPVVGTALLQQVVGFSPVPVVAIGGIDMQTLPSVLAAGAKNICCVRYLMETENLEERILKLKADF